jgi:hypothetical protein
MNDWAHSPRAAQIKLIVSVVLLVIAISLVPLAWCVAAYMHVVLSMFVMLFFIIPGVSSVIAIASLLLAISARRCCKYGWIYVILSSCAVAFPLIFTFWFLPWFLAKPR